MSDLAQQEYLGLRWSTLCSLTPALVQNRRLKPAQPVVYRYWGSDSSTLRIRARGIFPGGLHRDPDDLRGAKALVHETTTVRTGKRFHHCCPPGIAADRRLTALAEMRPNSAAPCAPSSGWRKRIYAAAGLAPRVQDNGSCDRLHAPPGSWRCRQVAASRNPRSARDRPQEKWPKPSSSMPVPQASGDK